MSRAPRAVVVLVVGLGACGDNRALPPDASPTLDAPADGSPLDAATDGSVDATSMVTVSVAAMGDGTGTFTVNGSACAAPCMVTVPRGSYVAIEATPDADSFVDWSVTACTPQSGNTCTVVADQTKTVNARFNWPYFELHATEVDGTGSIDGPVGSLCSSVCYISAKPGAQLTFTASASATTHSAVQRWSLAACGNAATCTFTVPNARNPTAFVSFGRDNSVDNGATTFTASKQGNPKWDVGGFQIVSVYGNELNALQRLWDGHLFNGGANAFYPGTTHAGPYATEAASRVTALGWDSGNHFPQIDWSTSASRTLSFVGTIVPSSNAPQGSTKDYANGLIIPRDLALYVDGDMYKDTTLIDAAFDQPYGTLAQIDPMSTEDGWSHMTVSLGENESFIPGTPGNYHLHIHIYEIAAPANGWQVDIPFVIDP